MTDLTVCRSRWSIHLRSVQKKKEDFTAFGQKGGKKDQSGNTVLPIKYSTKKPKKELLKEEKCLNLFFLIGYHDVHSCPFFAHLQVVLNVDTFSRQSLQRSAQWFDMA